MSIAFSLFFAKLAIAYLFLAYILTFQAITFIYKALLAIALDDDRTEN